MNFGFLITAYQTVDLVEENLKRIRGEYTILNNCPIVIVSTSEEDVGFSSLVEKYKNVYFINFSNAPPITIDSYRGFRHVQIGLGMRIFGSMELGMKKLIELDCDTIIHFHGDTYWVSEKENYLHQYAKELYESNALLSGDLCEEDGDGRLPNHTRFHPEALLINLKNAETTGYINLSEIFKDDNFVSDHWGCIEGLIAQFARYKLDGGTIFHDTKLPQIYYRNLLSRNIRPYHGHFDDGLVNIPIKQR